MLTREKLNKLYELTAAVAKAQDIASEQMRIAKDRFKERKQKMVREGKEIEITEAVMWEEVFLLGENCDSGRVLTKLHPTVFDAYRKQNNAAMELKKFCMAELGLNYSALTLSDYLKMTEGLFTLLMDERKSKNDKESL